MMLFNIINWENTDKNPPLNLITQSSRCDPDNVPFKFNPLMWLTSCVGGKEKSQLCVCVCLGACLTHPYAVYFWIYSKDTLMTSTVGSHLQHLSYEASQKRRQSEWQPFFSICKNTEYSILHPLKKYSGIWEHRTGHQCPFCSLLSSYLSETKMVSPAWSTAGVPNRKISMSGKVCTSAKLNLFKSCTF